MSQHATPASTAPPSGQSSLLPNAEQRARSRRIRMFKDSFSRYGISLAGFGVVGALALIFVYLFSEVAPLLKSAELDETRSFTVPGETPAGLPGHLVLERYEQLGASFGTTGEVTFFEVADGAVRSTFQLPVPAQADATSYGVGEAATGLVAYGFSDGQALVLRHQYELSYPNDTRLITPLLEYPLGEAPVSLDDSGHSLSRVAVQEGKQGFALAATTADNRLLLGSFTVRTNMFTGDTDVQRTVSELPPLPAEATALLVDSSLRHLFAADTLGNLHYYDIQNPNQTRLVTSIPTGRGTVTAMAFLIGSQSLIVGTDQGSLTQWMLVRDEANQYSLALVREFESHDAAITTLAPEYTRKGFLAGDAKGTLGIYYTTSHRNLLQQKVADTPLQQIAVSPINGKVLALGADKTVHVLKLWNQHPDVSFSALWEEVWYEGRSAPDYIWQASSGADDFEAKMSLVPLTLGTLKAAIFAMLFAMPLAIMGAIYTAYFMPAKLRGMVKPSIEIMEALPTVILGFLAGLWLAPFMENHLPAVFSILILMPLSMLVVAFLWSRLPEAIRIRVPEGWEAVILVPVILVVGWVCVGMSPHVEVWFFNGSMRQWFTDNGINYDQRNAMVVGVAMGFAVIPTIFSIAEDAVFNVPKHLTQGSLALGATRWQTVLGVVLPTASPGIFSAVMMGFGRAVGETMIVLMATGNSPVVNFNIFEGMRTLSANIAVELPETAVNSSHFRVLFLAALVLLAMTFVVNTIAEIVRQRLRRRYSNL